MPILMKRKDGTITPYRNAEFIPAYLFIPEEIIQKCPQEIKTPAPDRSAIQRLERYRNHRE